MEKGKGKGKVSKGKSTGSIRPSSSNPALRQITSPTLPVRVSKSNIVHRTISSTDNYGPRRPVTSNLLLGPKVLPGLPTGNEENVRVVVRVRPLSKKEEEKGCREVVIVDQAENVIEMRNPALELDREPKSFAFDGVFPGDTPQAELYNQVARPIVQNVIEGYNGTIFAYGQTGTGKTYTMEGENSSAELKGVIPNSFAQIFSHVSKAPKELSFLVRVSYLEIYNEDVRDLLGKDIVKKLEVKENYDSGVYVKDLSSFVVETEDDMDRIMRTGNKNRAVGSTNMNMVSSRSHAIFCITVECSTLHDDGEKSLRMGKLNLVDLAGSERVSKTGATGERLKEGAKINLSLSCLGNVISALVEGETHIPYRNSKLTRLLQDSLGGNSRTIMIANIGPADYNYEETLGTLRYADRAKHIRNRARINEDPKDALLRKFENEIEELKRLLEEEDKNPSQGGSVRSVERQVRPPPAPEAGTDTDDASSNCSGEGDEEREEDSSDVTESPLFPNADHDTLIEIKDVIRSQEKLTSEVQADHEQKMSTLTALKENVITWKQHQERKLNLEEKLKAIKKKIMIGGENLLDKSQEQEEFLQRAMQELEVQKEEQQKLRCSLTSIVAEKVNSEEKILDLQGTNIMLNRRLRKLWRICQRDKVRFDTGVDDEKYDLESVIDGIKSTCYSYRSMQTVFDLFIPRTAQKIILQCMTYNEENDCWSLPCIAYSGNNIELTDEIPETDPSYLMGLRKHPGRRRKRTKHIDYGFNSIYESDSDDDSDLDYVLREDDDTPDDDEMELFDRSYFEGFDKICYSDEEVMSDYFEEGIKPSGSEIMHPEDFFRCLENLPLYDPADVLFVGSKNDLKANVVCDHGDEGVTSEDEYEYSYGIGYGYDDCVQEEYGYGYDSDYGYS